MRTFLTELEQHQAMAAQLPACAAAIAQAGQLLVDSLRQGGKILLCGNGGSAADCQHIAAELVVRYEQKRQALPAIALTTDSSVLTAYSNDYDFSGVFARQVQALGRPGDCLVAISTSGDSANIVNAAQAGLALGLAVVALTGARRGRLPEHATVTVAVPSTVTARIQEAHILIGHWWCALVEDSLGAGGQ